MRAVFYSRVSTASEDQLNSLENQISFFDGYMRENNYEKVNVGVLYKRDGSRTALLGGYGDEGLSGTKLKKREAFKQMIQDAKNRKFDIILTKSISRFGRSIEDLSKTIKDLKEIGVAVFFLDINTSTMDSSREFLINIFASAAQEESRNKSSIIQFGIRQAQKQGKYTNGHAPYGYDLLDGNLQVNHEEAEVIKLIFDLYYNQAFGLARIAKYLTDKGIPTKKGKEKWSVTSVKQMLKNLIYVGELIQHTVQIVDINREIRQHIPVDEQIVHYKPELAIIDKKLFDLVDLERNNRKSIFVDQLNETNGGIYWEELSGRMFSVKGRGFRHSNKHLFSNLLFCGNCNAPLKRKRRKNRKDYSWVCKNRDMYGSKGCTHLNTRNEEYLLELVKNELIKYRENTMGLQKSFDDYLYTYIGSTEKNSKLIAKINEELAVIKKNQDKLYDLHYSDIIDKSEFKQRNDKFESEISVKDLELQKLHNIEERTELAKVKFNEFIKLINDVDINNLTNGVLRKIINRIEAGTLDEIFESYVGDLNYTHIYWMFMDKIDDEIIYDMAQKDLSN